MPSKDWNGTTTYDHGKIVDWNGTTSNIIGKGWDWNGTTSSLFYKAWDGELLDGADEFEDVTGGYDATKYTGNTWMKDAAVTSTGIAIYSGSGSWHETGTVNKIDVTNYSTITFNLSAAKGFYTFNMCFGLYNNQSTVYNQGVKSVTASNYTSTSTTSKTYTLDVSSLSGSYYLALYCYAGANYPVTITKITMS